MATRNSFSLFVFFLTMALLLNAVLVGNCLAETTLEKHESLRKSYFRLKNIGPNIEDPSAWTKVISNYRDYLSDGENSSDKVLFEYGSLLLTFGRTRADIDHLKDARVIFETLVHEYPESSLADDALIKRAEVLAITGADEHTIHEAYNQVLQQFPESDMAEVAKARLATNTGFRSRLGFSSPDSTAVEKDLSAKNVNLPVVVLDPGHGGEDFGAQNDLGLMEKDVVLSIALEVERLVKQRGFARVILTRKKDSFVPLLERVAIANDNKAALYLSLHNNASPDRKQAGLVTYVLDDSSDEASRLLAERENKSASADPSAVTDLEFIVSDLVQSSKHPKSLLLGEIMDKAVISSVKPVWPQAKSLGIKKAPFYVLVGAHMPCALIEIFFLDHEHEGEQLTDPAIRKKIAEGISHGIEQFLAKTHG